VESLRQTAKRGTQQTVDTPTQAYWSIADDQLLTELQATRQGLTTAEARARAARQGPSLKTHAKPHTFALFLGQFKSPIIIILLIAAVLSFFLGDATDGAIILIIVVGSGLLGFFQEHSAANAVERLLTLVQVDSLVLRDGAEVRVPVGAVLPGDIVKLSAGSAIPADCRVLEAKDLHVDEATLTGETFPVAKAPAVLAADTPLAQRSAVLYMGTHVVSGSALAVAVRTGQATEFGQISERLRLRADETEFERGVRRFGYLLSQVTLVMVLIIFGVNVFLHRPALDSFLFALALAVGLTPSLLPAIISVNLAHGARKMAEHDVIVKRLAAIENFGSMNVLCSDKTGTLTEGVVRIHGALNTDGVESERALLHAFINAKFETGFTNPIDQAIISHRTFDLTGTRKLDEVPYDFLRKRLSVLVEKDGRRLMVTKGALHNILEVCTTAESGSGAVVALSELQEAIQQRFTDLSAQGMRVLGLAIRELGDAATITAASETAMTFLGFLAFMDPPKAGIVDTIKELAGLGISLKMITGDNALVAANIGKQVGLAKDRVLTGREMAQMSDEALMQTLGQVDICAEIEPNQKERIILALRKAGNVVGYMGDGINDASALHAADVSISVANAADVAKDAADIVLLKQDLRVLVQGVREGRVTFANTLKYVFAATSANFGNMFSMAGASLFLPFLPLLPKQILLTNLLTDFPQMAIASDGVDAEMVSRPRRWDVRTIRNFMLVFGPISSFFDFLTFGVLLLVLHASPTEFRAGWFVESVISAALVVLVIRTRKPFFRSKPGVALRWATVMVVGLTLLLPYTPVASVLGFAPLPLPFLLLMVLNVALYIGSVEVAKQIFYRGSDR
jgi:Mg2+-importing ATPase